MPQTIKLKRSAIAGQAPTVGQLDLGELAINTNDGKIFFKKNDGTESIVQLNAAAEGEAAKTSSSATTPAVAVQGDLWFDTANNKLKYYDGTNWQEVGSTLAATTVAGNSSFGTSSTDTATIKATSTFAAPSTFNDTVTTTGDTTLGNASGDTLTVNATSTFAGNVTNTGTVTNNNTVVNNGNTTLGNAGTDTLTVNATSTFAGNVTNNGTVTNTGNTTLGDAAGDTLTVNATSTFVNAATFNGGVTIQSGDSFTFDGLGFTQATKFQVLNAAGAIQFAGWVLDTDTNTAN